MMLDSNDSLNETYSNWQQVYTFWTDGVITLILVIVGVTGNVSMVVSLVCMAKRWLPLYYYFLTFSLWNTALLGSTVFFYCLPALDERIGLQSGQFTYLNLLGYLLANSGMTAAIWLVLSVTVERCLVVTRPLDQIVSEPRRRAKIVTVVISILAPIYNLPLFFELRVVNDGTDLAKSALRENTAYKIGYRIVSNMLFLSLVPFLSIIVMSIRIVYVVRHTMVRANGGNNSSKKKRKTKASRNPHLVRGTGADRRRSDAQSPVSRCHSGSAQKNAYTTHMTLVILATKFVLCYTLPTVLNILEIIVEPSTLQQEGLGFLVDISNLMVVADSVFNAFAYMSWRRKIQLQQTRVRRKLKSARGKSMISNATNSSSLKIQNGSCRNGASPLYTRIGTNRKRSPDFPLAGQNMREHAV